MAKYINSDQLKEIYFNTPSTIRSFQDYSKMHKIKSNSKAVHNLKQSYEKLTDEEIERFETVFNKHYYKNVKEDTHMGESSSKFQPLSVENYFEDKQFIKTSPSNLKETYASIKKMQQENEPQSAFSTISKTGDDQQKETPDFDSQLIKQELEESEQLDRYIKAIDELQTNPETSPKGLKPTVEPLMPFDDEAMDEDEDLLYLDNLVASGGIIRNSSPLSSIGNIFDEIVDNEKVQISNYETEVFNANVQSLLEEDPEKDLQPITVSKAAEVKTEETEHIKTDSHIKKTPIIENKKETAPVVQKSTTVSTTINIVLILLILIVLGLFIHQAGLLPF